MDGAQRARIDRRDRGPKAMMLAVLLFLVGAVWVHDNGYRLNLSQSHTIGIYRIVNQPPAVGLYALFCAPLPIEDLPPVDRDRVPPCTANTEGYLLLKRIETVDIDNDIWTVRGDHPLSLDSRHFGPLARADIVSVAVQVWPKTKKVMKGISDGREY